MRSILALLVIITLVAGQGSSAAWAICHHKNAQDHAAARQSRDGSVAAVAFTEEAAASVDVKKGSTSAAPSLSASAMVLPVVAVIPIRNSKPVRRRIGDGPPLNGASLRPLLQPPSA